MKCPVCNREQMETKAVCEFCGFDDIRSEFINDEELKMWQAYVVRPCRYAYSMNHTLQKEVALLRREIAKLVSTSNRTHDANGSIRVPPLAQPDASIVGGYNYDDPITHPNSAECIYFGVKSRVFNIKAEMTSSSTATISFVVQKTHDAKGKDSAEMTGVRYRVKDADGIIVLNELHYVRGLKIGDASKEVIKLKGIATAKYSIDFTDY